MFEGIQFYFQLLLYGVSVLLINFVTAIIKAQTCNPYLTTRSLQPFRGSPSEKFIAAKRKTNNAPSRFYL